MVNVATATYPKYLCKPCAASRRGMLSQSKAEPETKAVLSLVEKEYPQKWKETIRCGRVKPQGEHEDIPGVNCIGNGSLARKGFLAKFHQEVISHSGVRVEGSSLQLPKKAFIAQCKLHWGESNEDAIEIWRKKIFAKNLLPDTEGIEKVLVPFFPPVATIGSYGRNHSRSIAGGSQDLKNEDDMHRSLELMNGANSQSDLLNNFKDFSGDQFQGVLESAPAMSSKGLSSDVLSLANSATSQPVVVIAGAAEAPEGENDEVRKDASIVPRSLL